MQEAEQRAENRANSKPPRGSKRYPKSLCLSTGRKPSIITEYPHQGPAADGRKPLESGHRAISSCAAVERSGDVDRLLAFTASSRTSFHQGSPVSPASIPLGIDSPNPLPPAHVHLPPAPPPVHRILCTRHGSLRWLYTEMCLYRIPCTQNPVYTAG